MFWHKFSMLSFIPHVTKTTWLLSLGRIHSIVGCHQEFKADLKSYLNLPLQQIGFVWLWAQEWEGVCYIQYKKLNCMEGKSTRIVFSLHYQNCVKVWPMEGCANWKYPCVSHHPGRKGRREEMVSCLCQTFPAPGCPNGLFFSCCPGTETYRPPLQGNSQKNE